MSGTASTSVVTVGVGGGGELGYGGYRAPFTPVQWQELEHQAMIYKYLVAGLPVPPDLVMPIRRSFDALSSRFFNHPSLGYCSYYGKKFDPEPGRCRRTDGKKWRCSKDAHPDSKYCERHMHRGRNRSRKPVESQATSQPLSTAAPNISTGGGGGGNIGSFQGGGNGSFQNMPLYSVVSTEGASFGGSMMQMEPMLYGINNNREFSFSHGASANVESLGLGSGTGSGAWRLMPSQVSSTSLLDQKSDTQLLGHSSAQQNVPIDDKQQHCFFGSEIASPGSVKQQEQQHPVHPFFSEWPSTKESWSNLEDDGSNKNIFSSTQLSISIPRASSDFSSRSAYSPNDG